MRLFHAYLIYPVKHIVTIGLWILTSWYNTSLHKELILVFNWYRNITILNNSYNTIIQVDQSTWTLLKLWCASSMEILTSTFMAFYRACRWWSLEISCKHPALQRNLCCQYTCIWKLQFQGFSTETHKVKQLFPLYWHFISSTVYYFHSTLPQTISEPWAQDKGMII